MNLFVVICLLYFLHFITLFGTSTFTTTAKMSNQYKTAIAVEEEKAFHKRASMIRFNLFCTQV